MRARTFRYPLHLAWIAVLVTVLGAVPTATAQLGTGDVTVQITIYTCPENIDPAADREALAGQCLDSADPYSITIGDGATWADGDEATGDAPQEARFSEVPAGIIQLVQHVPDGMGEPMILCAESTASETGEFAPALTFELQSDSFHLHAWVREVEPGATLTCQVFNFPSAVATPVASPVASPVADTASTGIASHGSSQGEPASRA